MTHSKFQKVALGCLSLATLSMLCNISPAQAQNYEDGGTVQQAQIIVPADRYEYRDTRDLDDRYEQQERFRRRSSYWSYQRCLRLEQKIAYLEQAREHLRNQGDYQEARTIKRELREAESRYRTYCSNN